MSMLDHVFTDAIGALRDTFENALLERQAFEEHFQADVLLGDLTWETSYGLPGEGQPPRGRADITILARARAPAPATSGDALDPERLLELGVPLEGHEDNLAATLAGGVCLTWDCHIARLADPLPFVPVAVVPESRVLTAPARASLPEQIPHAAAA